MSNLNQTPSANRLHIGIFGKRNSGKSSLINALTNQSAALVSEIAGTTTDPVFKAMEVRNIGACVFIDTAGFDDVGELGGLRVEKTKVALEKTDIAIMVFADNDFAFEKEWLTLLKAQNTPVLAVVSHLRDGVAQQVADELRLTPIVVDSITKDGIDRVLSALTRLVPAEYETKSITEHLVSKNDVVMLVMPQDSEAPKGRLILPQVQVTRDLLDNDCTIVSCTPQTMERSLQSLKAPPSLIITDSKVFKEVFELTPKESKLTSFSIIMAAAKGDLQEFINGAEAIGRLNEQSHVLIAEACTHAPLSEDIGRVKIPAMLKKKFGEGLRITVVSGVDFPDDLSGYDLIIHCGGCMFNRKYILSRIAKAEAFNVPITNYGVLLAKLNGILDKVTY